MKFAIMVGTRPEIIKVMPVIREMVARKIPYVFIHSNQHYSPEMDNIFFEEFELPHPHYNLNVGTGSHAHQLGNIMIKLEPILSQEKVSHILVQGDTNTVLAGALIASRLGIKVAHIEAGLRSYDRTMPEESNRVLTDHLSDFLFAVGPTQEKILQEEGLASNKVFRVGNTIVDAVKQNLPYVEKNSTILGELNLAPKEYCLVTAHRGSNVDTKEALEELSSLFKEMIHLTNLPLLWPIHPRSHKNLTDFDIKLPEQVRLVPPVGYKDFLLLQKNAFIVLTDSGGVQEECCIMGIPTLTIRENTERPETLQVGANYLIGRCHEKLRTGFKNIIEQKSKNVTWPNPFGDGKASQRIIEILINNS